MSLYDRKYLQDQAAQDFSSEQYQGRVSSFVKDTYKLLTASMVAATAGAYIGMQMGAMISIWLFLIVEIALLCGMSYATKSGKNTLALTLLFAFTFITGFSIGPVIAFYVGAGLGHIVTQAFLMTAVAFGALTVYAMNTKTNFQSWGKPLFYILIAVVVVSILNLLLFKSTIGSLAVSGVSAVLFSAFILYDTQNIIRGNYDSPVMAAVGMYLNIFNLFLSLLNILGITSRN